jgi:hypothetical protein
MVKFVLQIHFNFNEKSEKSEKVDKDQETEVKGIIRQFFRLILGRIRWFFI